MNELFKINTDSERITISARDLHAELEVTDRFNRWFERMLGYGFEKETDFTSVKTFTVVNNGAKRELDDYQITIDMAKEIAMLQRTEKGKEIRQKLIQLEKDWNSPEKVMARALIMANKELDSLKISNKQLTQTVQKQEKEIIHKEDVIIGLVDDIDLATKRQRIVQIVKYRSNKYKERYSLLYSEFERKYHVNLKRRMESCDIKPKIKSKLDYIDRGMGKISELYELACKLFENDVRNLMKEWEITIERN